MPWKFTRPRRSFLLGAAALGVQLSAGCSTIDDEKRRSYTTVERILIEQLAVEQGLVAAYEQVAPESPALVDHTAHVEALRARLPAQIASPSPLTFSGDLAEAERQSAQGCLVGFQEVPSDVGDVAALFASMTACERSHDVGSDGQNVNFLPDDVMLRADDTTAAHRALEAEYAAVWGYGALGARLEDPLQGLVRQADRRHRFRRDLLIDAVSRANGEIPAPEAAYELPVLPDSEENSLRVALHLEERCASAWREFSVESVANPVRAVDGLSECAAWAVVWRRQLGIVPDTIPFP